MERFAEHGASLWFKQLAKPTEIADVAVFLASAIASCITGQVLRVDGGSI